LRTVPSPSLSAAAICVFASPFVIRLRTSRSRAVSGSDAGSGGGRQSPCRSATCPEGVKAACRQVPPAATTWIALIRVSGVAPFNSGQGRFENKAQGLLYEGEFLAGQFDGKGSLHIHELAYEGMFKAGAMEGAGTLSVGKLTMRGDFKAGVLARGTITGADGRTFQVDIDKNEILEVMKDGSKRPLDELPPDVTI
jgi:hypothetical protein